MGIWSLTTFMNKVVPNGIVEVSIAEECRKYSENNEGRKPTLVIDIMGLHTIINGDLVDMYYGQSHRTCFNAVDKLFKALSDIADLVFFQDGPVADQKEKTFIERGNSQYELVIAMIDKVNQKIPIVDIVENWELPQFPGIASGFEFLTTLAAKYGTFKVSVTKECDAEIAQFACNNPSVIAVLAEDSDFLIFPGKWKYFSIKHFDAESLTTIEYNRTALRSFLGLNDQQLAVLSTMAGNDIVRYDEVSHCHGRRIGNLKHYKDARSKFLGMALKIKTFDGWNFHGLISFLASFLLRDISDESKQKIFESIDQYNIRFVPVDNIATTPLLKFCRKKNLNFAYSVLQRKTFNLNVGFYDRRNKNGPHYHVVHEKLKQRQMGVILQHQRPAIGNFVFVVYSKKFHSEPMQKHLISPVYPDFKAPNLIELLDRENFPQHDQKRFKILTWSISDTLKDIDVTAIPKPYLRHVLTLHFMVAEGFITKFDADIILLTIKDAAEGTIPDDYDYPPIVDPSAFQFVFIFLDFFIEIEESFKAAGLIDLTTHQTFEGGYFHKKYLDFLKSKVDPSKFLQDTDNYRTYKNLADKSSALSLKVNIDEAFKNLSLDQ